MLSYDDVRSELAEISGLEVREYVSPSGLMVQGTSSALLAVQNEPAVLAQWDVPLAMFLDDTLLDAMMFEDGIQAVHGEEVRLEGWWDDQQLDDVSIADSDGNTIQQSLSDVAMVALDDATHLDQGQYRGNLAVDNLLDIVRQPSVMWLRFEPQMTIDNDQSKNHMKINTMRSYFTTDLDGSGQIVAVADSGLDEDHGDFGTRVVGNYDVIGDGSTADKHSGHGTTSHVPYLAMEARVVMQVLHQMLNCISRQWKTTTLGILFHLLSTICSIQHTTRCKNSHKLVGFSSNLDTGAIHFRG